MAMIAMLMLSVLGAPAGGVIAQLNVEGTVYTSPTFGNQLQWSDPWFFVEEFSEAGADYLFLADGMSDANFILAFAPGVTVQDVVNLAISDPQPGASGFEPMLDEQGNPVAGATDGQEWVVYTGTQDLGDGSSIQVMQYFSVDPVQNGVVLMASIATVSYFWNDSTLQSWHDLTSSILVEAPGPEIAATAAPLAPTPPAPAVATSIPEPTAASPAAPSLPDDRSALSDGEPAPVFAAGPWRVAVRAVDLGQSIDYLGLGFVDGQQWVVIYADVTNWSETDAQLESPAITLVTATGSIEPDTASTQSTASSLGLEPMNGTSVLVPAETSIRVALVYTISAGEQELVLELDGMRLPLEDAVGRQFDVTDLSTIARPPDVIAGTLRGLPATENGQPTFVVETSNGDVPVHLAGVDFTEDGRCTAIGGAALEISVDAVPNETVWLESDPAIPDVDAYYVWIEDEDGTRVLLNERIIAGGMAFEGNLPEAARFGAWLEQSEEIARFNKQGFWEFCA
jgi:hypothetical protein